MSVRLDRIKKYLSVFNAAWGRAVPLESVDQKYAKHCEGKDIRDLHELIDTWEDFIPKTSQKT